jgi:hypothetical protein
LPREKSFCIPCGFFSLAQRGFSLPSHFFPRVWWRLFQVFSHFFSHFFHRTAAALSAIAPRIHTQPLPRSLSLSLSLARSCSLSASFFPRAPLCTSWPLRVWWDCASPRLHRRRGVLARCVALALPAAAAVSGLAPPVPPWPPLPLGPYALILSRVPLIRRLWLASAAQGMGLGARP